MADDYEAQLAAEIERRLKAKEAKSRPEVIEQEPKQAVNDNDDYEYQLALEKERRRRLKLKSEQAEVPSQPQPEEEEPGLFANIGKGAGYGAEDIARQKTILSQLMAGEIPEPVPVPHGAELDWSRKGVGQFIGRTATSAGPAMAAGLGGAWTGSKAGLLAGPVAGTVGGIAGGAIASTPIATAQAYADAYNESRLAGQGHEEALKYAGKIAKVSGGINALAAGLGGVGIKDAFLKQAVKQIPIQTGIANAENITRNIIAKEEGVDPNRELLAGTKEATFGPGAIHVLQAAGTKALTGGKNILKGKPEPVLAEPKAPIAPTEEAAAITKPIVEEAVVPHGMPEEPVKSAAMEMEKPPTTKAEKIPKDELATVNGEQFRYDKKTKKWNPLIEKTEGPTVIPAEETNLGRKKGITEEQKAAADVNLDEIHQKIYGNVEPEKAPSFVSKIVDRAKAISKDWLGNQGLFDAHAPIKELEAKAGIKTAGESPAYRGARFARNVQGMLKAAYDYGRPYYDKSMNILRVNSEAPGFTTIINSVAKTPKMLKDFQTYAYARRVKTNKLIEAGKEQNLKPHEVDAAIKLEEAHPEFKQAFDEIQEYNKSILDIMEDTGLINGEQRSKWEEMDYVPFYRELGENLGINVTNKGKGLTGQKAKIKELKGKMKEWQVFDANNKEIYRTPNHQEALEMAAKHDFKVGEEHVGNQTSDVIENLYRNISSFIPAAIKNVAAVNTLHLAVQHNAAERVSKAESVNKMGSKHPDIVTVMEKGEPVNYRVTDPALYKAVVESYGRKTERGEFGKLMQGIKGVLSTAIVTNPAIAIGIAAKDIIQSGLVGKYSMGHIKGLLVDLPKEIVKSYAHEFGVKLDPRLVDISAMGAESRFSDVSPEMRNRQMQRVMDKHNGKVLTWLNTDTLRNSIDKIITPLENANRLRKFEAAKKAGKDLAAAGYESLDYMDYGKKGSGGLSAFLRDFVPFAGSHISSTHTLATELGHNKGVNPTTAKLLTLSAFSGLNAAHNLDDSNDPDPSNGYMSLPDYVRDNNWCIDTYKFSNGKERFKNGDVRWIIIPKPWEAGQLGGSVIENLMAVYKGEEDGKDILRYIGKQFSDYLTINPFGHPLIKTGIEQFANKQFFQNMPIVPRQTEELEPFMQFGHKTSETAKKIGKALDYDIVPSWAKSPARIEHAAKGIIGSYADYIFMAGDIMSKDPKGEKPDKDFSKQYVVNKFVKGTVLERTAYENELYDLYISTKTAHKSLLKLQKDNPELAGEYHKKNAPLIAKASFADTARKQLKEFDNQRQRVLEDKQLTGKEKQEQIKYILKSKNQYLYNFHKQMKEEKKRN